MLKYNIYDICIFIKTTLQCIEMQKRRGNLPVRV